MSRRHTLRLEQQFLGTSLQYSCEFIHWNKITVLMKRKSFDFLYITFHTSTWWILKVTLHSFIVVKHSHIQRAMTKSAGFQTHGFNRLRRTHTNTHTTNGSVIMHCTSKDERQNFKISYFYWQNKTKTVIRELLYMTVWWKASRNDIKMTKICFFCRYIGFPPFLIYELFVVTWWVLIYNHAVFSCGFHKSPSSW